MLFLKFERLLAGRDSRKIGNNTWLKSHRMNGQHCISLVHFRFDLIDAHADGRTIVRPWYSMTSFRRLRAYIGCNIWQKRGLCYYVDPAGVEHKASSYLKLDAGGFVQGTDYTPPPVWLERPQHVKNVLRMFIRVSFSGWLKRPVEACVRCKPWQTRQQTDRLKGAALWAAVKANDHSAAIQTCFWHSDVLHKYAPIGAYVQLMRDLSLANRQQFLRKTKRIWVQAAVDHFYKELNA